MCKCKNFNSGNCKKKPGGADIYYGCVEHWANKKCEDKECEDKCEVCKCQ